MKFLYHVITEYLKGVSTVSSENLPARLCPTTSQPHLATHHRLLVNNHHFFIDLDCFSVALTVSTRANRDRTVSSRPSVTTSDSSSSVASLGTPSPSAVCRDFIASAILRFFARFCFAGLSRLHLRHRALIRVFAQWDTAATTAPQQQRFPGCFDQRPSRVSFALRK